MPLFGDGSMARLPFSVYKRAGRRNYYVEFKNTSTGQYLPALNTKCETEAEAIQIAFQWLKDGIPTKGTAVPVKTFTLRDMARQVDVSAADCEYICKELKRRGLLKSYTLSGTKAALPVGDFLVEFWDYGISPYIKEKLRKKHGISKNYTVGQMRNVETYIAPFFNNKMMGELERADILKFVDYMGEKSLSAGRKNSIIKALTVPMKWAFERELIDKNITSGIVWFSGKPKERQILSPEQAQATFRVHWNDERARLANMLAMVTGMRAGEMQGLRVQDIGEACLYVRHSWNFRDGLKTTKNRESRTVEVPFPGLMRDLVELAKSNPHGVGMDSYVFWAELSPDKPIEADIFLRGLRSALLATGMSKASAQVYVFHGWRHYFTAYMRDRVTEKLLKSQTGHKTLVMLEHYAGHTIAGDRQRIQAAQIAAFGGLLPEQAVG